MADGTPGERGRPRPRVGRSGRLLAPGAALLLVGLGVMVFAYAGRSRGLLAVAAAGVLLLLAGATLLAVALARSVRRRIEEPTIAATAPAAREAAARSRSVPAGGTREHDGPSAGGGASEEVLHSFGPLGVDICKGPFRVFGAWHRKNDTTVELTASRLRALPGGRLGCLRVPALSFPWGVRLPFEIAYADIVSVELRKYPSPIALMEVLYLRYRVDGAVKDVSIASFPDAVERAYQTIVAAGEGRR